MRKRIDKEKKDKEKKKKDNFNNKSDLLNFDITN